MSQARVVLLAYSEMGCAGLEALEAAGAKIVAVFTHADDPEERRWFRSVREVAGQREIPVLAPEDINAPDTLARLRGFEPDLLLSIYYRRIVSREILEIPRLGAFNLHGSLLPRYRGRCPTNWAILMGERVTGVTLHRMVERADAGDIVAQREVLIGPDDQALCVMRRQIQAGRELLVDHFHELAAGMASAVPQDETLATCFGGRGPEDGLIDWSSSARAVHDLVRAVAEPYPGAITWLGERRCLIWKTRLLEECGRAVEAVPGGILGSGEDGLRVACGEGSLEVVRAQLPPDPALEGAALRSWLDETVRGFGGGSL